MMESRGRPGGGYAVPGVSGFCCVEPAGNMVKVRWDENRKISGIPAICLYCRDAGKKSVLFFTQNSLK